MTLKKTQWLFPNQCPKESQNELQIFPFLVFWSEFKIANLSKLFINLPLYRTARMAPWLHSIVFLCSKFMTILQNSKNYENFFIRRRFVYNYLFTLQRFDRKLEKFYTLSSKIRYTFGTLPCGTFLKGEIIAIFNRSIIR